MRALIPLLTIVAAAAAPAQAVTIYDAFSTFDGTSASGGFAYGVLDEAAVAPMFIVPYDDAPGCAALISNTICTSNGSLPAAFKSTSGAHQSGTVLVPGDALVLHPGPAAGQSSAVLFTVPVASTYLLSFSAALADTRPSGVIVELFAPDNFVMPLAELTSASSTYSLNALSIGYQPATAQFGFAINYDGLYNDDSTAVNFTLTAVPEPATWGLMVAGFAMTGFAARRRTPAVAV